MDGHVDLSSKSLSNSACLYCHTVINTHLLEVKSPSEIITLIEEPSTQAIGNLLSFNLAQHSAFGSENTLAAPFKLDGKKEMASRIKSFAADR